MSESILNSVKKSEASLAAQVYVKQESVIQPSMEIDRGERKVSIYVISTECLEDWHVYTHGKKY